MWEEATAKCSKYIVISCLKSDASLDLKFLFMVALCNRADHYIFILFLSSSSFFFLLYGRPPYAIGQTIYIFMLFLLLLLLSFFSSPNLSGRRLDVYHISAHGVALVRI